MAFLVRLYVSKVFNNITCKAITLGDFNLAINPSYRYSIMEALADDEFKPKRYMEILDRVKNRIRSERTLWLYLKDLEKEGLVARQQISHKKVLYEIPSNRREEWAFLAEPDPFGKHIPQGIHSKRIMSYLLESLGDKSRALDLALKYAFTSFFRSRTRIAAEQMISADRENKPLIIEKELRRYLVFLKFIESFVEKNSKAAHIWLEATRKAELPYFNAAAPRISVETGYPLQDQLNHEFTLLYNVVEENDPELAEKLKIPEAAKRIGLKLHKEWFEVIGKVVKPSEDIDDVIDLKDEIETIITPLIGERKKISARKLRMLYREKTGKTLTAAAFNQVMELAVAKGSPIWQILQKTGEKLPELAEVKAAVKQWRKEVEKKESTANPVET